MTRQLAVDYPTEMRVNCIAPGTVDTPFVEAYLEKYHRHEKEKVRAELSGRQPMGRLARRMRSPIGSRYQFAGRSLYDRLGGDNRWRVDGRLGLNWHATSLKCFS